MDKITTNILSTVADIDALPKTGAFNIRIDGAGVARNSTDSVLISPKDDGTGIDIHVKPGVKNERCHIPVVVKTSGLKDKVYNDFFIGDDAEITIIAGCGIHNDGEQTASHDGIHTFHLGKNSVVRYIEKHYAEGNGGGKRILNPETVYILGEGSVLEAETVQIEGVDYTRRTTRAELSKNAKLKIKEKLLTSGTHSINDNRLILDEEPIDAPWADAHIITKNYELIENLMKGGGTVEAADK